MPTISGRYWLLTIPVVHHPNQPQLRDDLIYLKGQQERGEQGLLHWQILAAFKKKVTIAQAKTYFCTQAHLELTRSEAADDYVHKDETALIETRFEIGQKASRRNSDIDWERTRTLAKAGDFDAIDPDIFIRHYSSLKRIRVDYADPVWRDNVQTFVYWGGTGLGKTRRAWHEAGGTVYVKDPNTKWWDGYKGQENVLIDEFTGLVAINHILRWIDRYPCFAEVKGYSTPLRATTFWITSNIDPRQWYPDANEDQKKALLRRLNITHFLGEWTPPAEPIVISDEPNDEIISDGEVRWDNDNSQRNELLQLLSGDFYMNL